MLRPAEAADVPAARARFPFGRYQITVRLGGDARRCSRSSPTSLTPDGLGPARLRDRQQPRGGAAHRHHVRRVLLSVYLLAGLLYGVAALLAGRAHRRRRPERRPDRQPRQRSPRSCSAAPACSAAAARSSARCIGALIVGVLPQRADPDGRRPALPDPRSPACWSSSRSPWTSSPAGGRDDRHRHAPRSCSRPRPGQAVRPRHRRSTAPTSSCCPARCSRSSATTAPASRA